MPRMTFEGRIMGKPAAQVAEGQPNTTVTGGPSSSGTTRKRSSPTLVVNTLTCLYLLSGYPNLSATSASSLDKSRLHTSQPLAANSEHEADDRQSGALNYLQRYGYLANRAAGNESSSNQLIAEEAFEGAVARFQRFAGIQVTGQLDEQTWNTMRLPRCGNQDNKQSQLRPKFARFGQLRRRRKRYALQGSKWRRQELTYRISQYPTRFQAKRHEVDAQIERAFGIWSQVAPINFVVKREGRVHIDIRFASGDHGDGDAFDGPGNTLAHAYFPQYGGDAHFDDQEYWTIDSYSGTNIFQVAAHELGHSLGLGHSNVREALMAPFYQKYKPNFKLHLDDVLAIQALYGEKASVAITTSPAPTSTSPSSTSTSKPSTSEPSSERPRSLRPSFFGREPAVEQPAESESSGSGEIADLCADPRIDAATRTEDGSTYVFKGDHYWRLTDKGLAEGYPRMIGSDWEGLPGKLDAALTWADGKTFFFKGNKYWRFKNRRRDLGYPKLISVGFSGIPDDIDAAFVWAGNGRTYIFKGAEYWRFDSKADPPVSSDYPRSIKTWTGVPAHVDAALRWDNNVTYFFKGSQYYRFNDKEFRVETRGRPAFPRASAEWWFGCPAGSNSLAAQRAQPVEGADKASGNSAAHEEVTPEQAANSNTDDWSFFASLEGAPKIAGTHISDQQRPPASAGDATNDWLSGWTAPAGRPTIELATRKAGQFSSAISTSRISLDASYAHCILLIVCLFQMLAIQPTR